MRMTLRRRVPVPVELVASGGARKEEAGTEIDDRDPGITSRGTKHLVRERVHILFRRIREERDASPRGTCRTRHRSDVLRETDIPVRRWEGGGGHIEP